MDVEVLVTELSEALENALPKLNLWFRYDNIGDTYYYCCSKCGLYTEAEQPKRHKDGCLVRKLEDLIREAKRFSNASARGSLQES